MLNWQGLGTAYQVGGEAYRLKGGQSQRVKSVTRTGNYHHNTVTSLSVMWNGPMRQVKTKLGRLGPSLGSASSIWFGDSGTKS